MTYGPGRPRCGAETRQVPPSPRASAPRNRIAPPAASSLLSGFAEPGSPASQRSGKPSPPGPHDAPGPRPVPAAASRPSAPPRPQASRATTEPQQPFLSSSQDSGTELWPQPGGESPSSPQLLKVPGGGGAPGPRPGLPQPP